MNEFLQASDPVAEKVGAALRQRVWLGNVKHVGPAEVQFECRGVHSMAQRTRRQGSEALRLHLRLIHYSKLLGGS